MIYAPRPTQVPDIRRSMIRTADSLGHYLSGTPNPLGGYDSDDTDSATNDVLDAMSDSLHVAEMWWVSPDLTDLVAHAWRSIPVTTMTDDLLPAKDGVIIFGKPVIGMDADNEGLSIPFHALQWTWLNLKFLNGLPSVAITAWMYSPGSDVIDWVPLGRADWPIGMDSDVRLEENTPQRKQDSLMEDRCMLAAVWLIAQQPRIAEAKPLVYSRQEHRRAERAKQPLPRVTVIDLRAPKHAPTSTRDVEWKHRWLVTGHWRQVPYGPGKQYRRPVWISPFVKGPDDAPFLVHEVVKAVK